MTHTIEFWQAIFSLHMLDCICTMLSVFSLFGLACLAILGPVYLWSKWRDFT